MRFFGKNAHKQGLYLQKLKYHGPGNCREYAALEKQQDASQSSIIKSNVIIGSIIK